MTVVRVRGIKRYHVRGRLFVYHRKTGIRLRAEYGTGAFFAELAAIEDRLKTSKTLPGTLGMLFAEYRQSQRFADLAPATQQGYSRMIGLLQPLQHMPVADLTPVFIAGLRDRMGVKHGRRQANYILAVVSVACEYGKEHGIVAENPVRGIRRLRRARNAPSANRPWSAAERSNVLDHVPSQLKLPIALAMFTGLRKSDVLSLTKDAIRDQTIWRKTSKTGQEVSLPLHPDLAALLADSPQNPSPILAVTSAGTPWTASGFNSSFTKAMARLADRGLIGPDLTFHGLRHTVGTLLIEAGADLDTVRRWLGQKTLAMAIHYSQNADTSAQMRKALENFDPLKNKKL